MRLFANLHVGCVLSFSSNFVLASDLGSRNHQKFYGDIVLKRDQAEGMAGHTVSKEVSLCYRHKVSRSMTMNGPNCVNEPP